LAAFEHLWKLSSGSVKLPETARNDDQDIDERSGCPRGKAHSQRYMGLLCRKRWTDWMWGLEAFLENPQFCVSKH